LPCFASRIAAVRVQEKNASMPACGAETRCSPKTLRATGLLG
jgi:hypothetical protein